MLEIMNAEFKHSPIIYNSNCRNEYIFASFFSNFFFSINILVIYFSPSVFNDRLHNIVYKILEGNNKKKKAELRQKKKNVTIRWDIVYNMYRNNVNPC